MLPAKKGFTLVELLITVSIIGVLTVIGVPTFRRMIAKSKQAEAKVMLGGLKKAEATFFAEYSLYSNNLNFIGFEADPLYYSVGFPKNGCEDDFVVPNSANTDSRVQTLLRNAPTHFDQAKAKTVVRSRDTQVGYQCGGGIVAPPGAGVGGIGVQCAGGTIFNCPTTPCYVPFAGGVIDPSKPRATATMSELDLWTILPATGELSNICTQLPGQSPPKQQQQQQQQGNQ